jgi:hypothetical protein
VPGGLVEFELDLIRSRTGEGRARGVKMGRKPKLTSASAEGGDQASRPGRAATRYRPQLQRPQQHDFKVIAVRLTPAALLAFVALLMSEGAYGEADKVQYELQERCGRAAAAAFERDNPPGQNGEISDTKEGQAVSSYENHYNVRLNKCFVMYSMQFLNYKSTPKTTTQSYIVFDVNENKEYGNLMLNSGENTPWECNVLKTFCHSEDEWRKLIRPYMED